MSNERDHKYSCFFCSGSDDDEEDGSGQESARTNDLQRSYQGSTSSSDSKRTEKDENDMNDVSDADDVYDEHLLGDEADEQR